MLHCKDLENTIMNKCLAVPTEQLNIISGYVGVEPIMRLANLPDTIHTTIIYGMYGRDGISAPLHNALVNLQKAQPNVTILYSTIPVHSKIYYWQNSDTIQSALVGSANFSVSGLRNDYREVLSDVEESSFADFRAYYEYVLKHSIPCTDASIYARIISKSSRTTKTVQPLLSKGTCRVYLLDNKGKVPKQSGLNWGCSKGHVSKGDAYIPIRMDYIKQFPGMFPPKKYIGELENLNSKGKKNRENDEVELIWDDGTVMVGLLEGQIMNKADNKIYPKQLSSSPQKSILGKYLRNRLGVDIEHVITKTDLRKYGRMHIDITLISEGLYYMDFSTNK